MQVRIYYDNTDYSYWESQPDSSYTETSFSTIEIIEQSYFDDSLEFDWILLGDQKEEQLPIPTGIADEALALEYLDRFLDPLPGSVTCRAADTEDEEFSDVETDEKALFAYIEFPSGDGVLPVGYAAISLDSGSVKFNWNESYHYYEDDLSEYTNSKYSMYPDEADLW